MSKKIQKDKQGFLCITYGGCMKLGYVRYFATENTPEDEFEKYKIHYGADIKGRYIKVANPSDAYSKVRAELIKLNVPNPFGDIYEIGVTSAVKVMKDATGVKKSSTWGMDDEGEKETKTSEKQTDSTETEKSSLKGKIIAKPKGTVKVTVKGKKTKLDVQEIDKIEEESENDSELSDSQSDNEGTSTPVKQQLSKKEPAKGSAKKPAQKKAAKKTG